MVHIIHQGVIVIQGVQLIGADGQVIHNIGKLTVYLKQAGVADKACPVQLLGNTIQGVGLGDGDIHCLIRTTKGQHVGSAHPQHPAQRSTNGDHERQPNDGGQDMGDTQQTVGVFVFRSSLSHDGGLLLRRLRYGFFCFFCLGGRFFLCRFRCGAVDLLHLAEGIPELIILKRCVFRKQQRAQCGITQRVVRFFLGLRRLKIAGVFADMLCGKGGFGLGGSLP